ncbi:LuxR C-terminal-related transcriptional regulator [Streptomyces anulatus]|uniref:LuxR C-terminal-related transcriptional regulator n=1 Tax=Streptomyces anulatus TaxID=1892 RepID=UPI001C5E6C34|nr:LuxR C-terminal-related transcriptional regulator [Streptomyces anulatus]QYA95903.1 LuxR C-terminal-related transcriptional regulator [Streptomyces anulatus]
MEGQPGRPPRATDPPPRLRRVSARSLSTVLEALAQGHTNTAVAQQLHISLSSVEKEA